MLLSELKIGDKARITSLSRIHEMLERRLLSLGMRPSAEICLKRRMPFGGPCLIELSGQCICMRTDEANQIAVELL